MPFVDSIHSIEINRAGGTSPTRWVLTTPTPCLCSFQRSSASLPDRLGQSCTSFPSYSARDRASIYVMYHVQPGQSNAPLDVLARNPTRRLVENPVHGNRQSTLIKASARLACARPSHEEIARQLAVASDGSSFKPARHSFTKTRAWSSATIF